MHQHASKPSGFPLLSPLSKLQPLHLLQIPTAPDVPLLSIPINPAILTSHLHVKIQITEVTQSVQVAAAGGTVDIGLGSDTGGGQGQSSILRQLMMPSTTVMQGFNYEMLIPEETCSWLAASVCLLHDHLVAFLQKITLATRI